jgi:hypothetical protein
VIAAEGQLEADPRFKDDEKFILEQVAPAMLNKLLERFPRLLTESPDTIFFYKEKLIAAAHLKSSQIQVTQYLWVEGEITLPSEPAPSPNEYEH